VLPEEDDGTESGGPPPDPSLREWRHPSEIAAAAAAAARPVATEPRSLLSPLLSFGGTALGVTVIVGLALYLTGTGLPRTAGQSAAVDDPLRPPAGSVDVPLTTEATSERAGAGGDVAADDRESSEADGQPPTAFDQVDEPTPSDSVNTTTSTAAAPTNQPAGESTSETVDTVDQPDLLAPEHLPDDESATEGIYGLGTDDLLEHLTGYLVIDGLIFTPSSPIETADVAVRGPSGWTTATVLDVDPVTDVAVLAVDDPAMVADDGQRASGDEDVEDRDATEERPSTLRKKVSIVGSHVSAPTTGVITALSQTATVDGGRSIYGALRTSIPNRDGADGATLVAMNDGAVLGLVVASDDPLVSAIPVATLRRIGNAVTTVGAPAVEWLGVRGSLRPAGGVTIDEIIESSPADGIDMLDGDAVLALDGEAIANMNHLAYLVREAGAENTVRLRLLRDGRLRTVDVTIGLRPVPPSEP